MSSHVFFTDEVVDRLKRNGVEVVQDRYYTPPGGHPLTGEVLVGVLDRIERRRARELRDWEV